MFSYEKITQLNESTPPFTKRRPKTPFRIRGGGVIPSTHGKAAFQRKQREKRPSSIPFRSKGVHMQRKNTTPGHTDNPEPKDKIAGSKAPRGKATDLSGFVRNVKKPSPA